VKEALGALSAWSARNDSGIEESGIRIWANRRTLAAGIRRQVVLGAKFVKIAPPYASGLRRRAIRGIVAEPGPAYWIFLLDQSAIACIETPLAIFLSIAALTN